MRVENSESLIYLFIYLFGPFSGKWKYCVTSPWCADQTSDTQRNTVISRNSYVILLPHHRVLDYWLVCDPLHPVSGVLLNTSSKRRRRKKSAFAERMRFTLYSESQIKKKYKKTWPWDELPQSWVTVSNSPTLLRAKGVFENANV